MRYFKDEILEKIHTLYHGSDHEVGKPKYGFGKTDNDYGQGFYTTLDPKKADEWAVCFGGMNAVTNRYFIDTQGLNILFLDDYGPLAWVTEIISNRGVRGENASLLATKLIEKYKIDTTHADIIVGYRADDSYIDVVDSFLKNEISLEETARLFYKGDLGLQVFIKSQRAFERMECRGARYIAECKRGMSKNEEDARIGVARFLKNRASQIIVNGYQPYGILARDAALGYYLYNRDYEFYEAVDEKAFTADKPIVSFETGLEGVEHGD